MIESSLTSARPVTPPSAVQPLQPINALIQTIEKPGDIHETVKELSDKKFSQTSTRLVLQKVAKAIAMKNTTAAQLQVRINA